MSYFLVYCCESGDHDGDDLASNAGWAALVEYVDRLVTDAPDDFVELAVLAERGELWPAAALDDLEAELSRVVRDGPSGPPAEVRSTAARLLELVRERPADCEGVIVTDGASPGGDDEDDPDD